MPALPSSTNVALSEVKLPKIELPAARSPVGSPTDLYTRIARGILTCWMGANGPLKGKYGYHADAQPPSKGGKAEISIFQIDAGEAQGRGPRVFRLDIEPQGESAVLDIHNTKLPDAMAQDLAADIHRWGSSLDEVSCRDTAPPPAAAPTPANALNKPAQPVKKPAKTT